jgi:hypothetical protein
MHLIWIVARNEALFLAYRVAMPPQRFRWRKVFSRQANALRSKIKRGALDVPEFAAVRRQGRFDASS